MSNQINPTHPAPQVPPAARQQNHVAPPNGIDLIKFGLVTIFMGGVVMGGVSFLAGAYYGDSDAVAFGIVMWASTHYLGKQVGII